MSGDATTHDARNARFWRRHLSGLSRRSFNASCSGWITFLSTLAFLWTIAAFGAPLDGQIRRPNVLMIAIDDLNDWVGCLQGHPQVRTPNIDRLAAQGTLFLNAHCQAPLCNPSRSSLLTGLRPSSTGIYGLVPGIRQVEATRDVVTLPQYFRAHGYFTASFGKVFHDGSIPPNLRSNEFHLWGPAPGIPTPPKKFVNTPDKMAAMDWGIFPEHDRDQADWKTAEAAINQLKGMPPERPFFLAVGFRLPHVPCFASQKWFDLYPPQEQIQLPAYLADDRADVPPFSWYLHWKLPEPRLAWLQDTGQWRPLVRAYLASTTFMDSQIGRLLGALDSSGYARNTVIVLWSDNGWHLGEKGITGKNTLWDRSTRVPLIFAGSGVTRSGRCLEPAELLDIYPTLIDLCGLAPRVGLEGHSLVPQLHDPQGSRLWPAITSHNQGNDSVRTTHWRYTRYADGSEELYDYRRDPHEWHNLAGLQQHHALKQELARWLPESPNPPAPGSAHRVLVKQGDQWLWEGKAITPPVP